MSRSWEGTTVTLGLRHDEASVAVDLARTLSVVLINLLGKSWRQGSFPDWRVLVTVQPCGFCTFAQLLYPSSPLAP